MMRSFTVQEGVKGFVVSIGCQVAGFSTKKDLIKAIAEYVNNPEETEKKYYIKGRSPLRDETSSVSAPSYSLTEADMRNFGRTAMERTTATQVAATQSLAQDLHNAFTEGPVERPSVTATAIAKAEGAGTAVIRPPEQGRVTRETRT